MRTDGVSSPLVAIRKAGGADVSVVEFTIRLSELRKAQKQLLFNRGVFKETDCADILISPCVATFRAVGTEFEAPVNGSHPGPVRMPLKTLNELVKAAGTFRKSELKLHFEPGKVQVERFMIRHPDVALGIFPDQKFDLPPDAGVLDTLAMASVLSPEQIVDQGLRERVEAAQKYTSLAVSSAEATLREQGIRREHIQQLVDARIKDTAQKLAGVIQDRRPTS
jgi:hypothetical protein